MRIDALNQVSRVYEANKTKKVSKNSETDKRDQFEISQSAKDYQTVKKALSQTPDIREDKVAEIKSAMNSGTYNVSAQEIADKMVSKYFDIGI
ncbi:MAG: flagellar biosynthesis anti-sigma factor FlgM [Lachnospiraceae bacterium]|nr:flagellar biosynthesis anti-sigma factor FlgM [Lachnospiraceae bacterium]MCI5587472.1 flagellar biosynthesis anti-sigma factor FlgM [Lachnospiraceae bacterium]